MDSTGRGGHMIGEDETNMADHLLNARFQQKIDTTVNWAK